MLSMCSRKVDVVVELVVRSPSLREFCLSPREKIRVGKFDVDSDCLPFDVALAELGIASTCYCKA